MNTRDGGTILFKAQQWHPSFAKQCEGELCHVPAVVWLEVSQEAFRRLFVEVDRLASLNNILVILFLPCGRISIKIMPQNSQKWMFQGDHCADHLLTAAVHLCSDRSISKLRFSNLQLL